MILKNVTALTVDQNDTILKGVDIEVKDGIITNIGTNICGENEIDLTNMIVMPGFINTHAHMPMTIFRSLAEEDNDRLMKYVFPIEGKFITPQNVQIATNFCLLETIASGQTTIADMYYYDKEIADCFKQANVRMLACETIIDEGGETFNNKLGMVSHFEALYSSYSDDDLISVCIAPHAPYTNSLDKLIECSRISDEKQIPLMIHVSEMKFEIGEFRDGKSVIQYLDKHNLINERTILVHAIYLEEEDYKIIVKRGAKVAHCPVSNAKGGRATMNLAKMYEHKITVGLGSDGAMSGNRMDLHSSMYFMSKMHKHSNLDRGFLKNSQVIRMATIDGAKVLGLDHKIGSLEVGKKADLIVIDPTKYNMQPLFDIESAIVNTLDSSNIKMTVVNGKIIYKDNKFLTINEKDVTSSFTKLATQISKYVNID